MKSNIDLDYSKAQLTWFVRGAQKLGHCLGTSLLGSSQHLAPNQHVNLDRLLYPLQLSRLYLYKENNVSASIMQIGKQKRFQIYVILALIHAFYGLFQGYFFPQGKTSQQSQTEVSMFPRVHGFQLISYMQLTGQVPMRDLLILRNIISHWDLSEWTPGFGPKNGVLIRDDGWSPGDFLTSLSSSLPFLQGIQVQVPRCDTQASEYSCLLVILFYCCPQNIHNI